MAGINPMIELLEAWSDFEKTKIASGSTPEIRDFCMAYLESFYVKKAEADFFDFTANDLDEQVIDAIQKIEKISNFFIKKATFRTLNSVEDWYFLNTMLVHRDQPKSSLIEKNFLDNPTGFDVIERLEKLKLADSIPNPKDKRAKLSRLTPKGRLTISKLKKPISDATELALKPLGFGQKFILLQLLLRILDHHQEKNYAKIKENTLETLKVYYAD